MTTTLPAPPTGRYAAYNPASDDRGPFAVIHLDGWHAMFRLLVNVLGYQVDFAKDARAVLVEMRDDMTPARFDPFALQMLGADRYKTLRDRFERHWECVSCYTEVKTGAKYYPTDEAGAVCARCCSGYPEYTTRLKTRQPEPQPAAHTTQPAAAPDQTENRCDS